MRQRRMKSTAASQGRANRLESRHWPFVFRGSGSWRLGGRAGCGSSSGRHARLMRLVRFGLNGSSGRLLSPATGVRKGGCSGGLRGCCRFRGFAVRGRLPVKVQASQRLSIPEELQSLPSRCPFDVSAREAGSARSA